MNNNELNALVAERVMNLRNVRLFMDSNMFVYDDIRTYAINIHGKETITYQPVPIPNYANDIAAAWQVAEKLRLVVRPTVTGQWCAAVLFSGSGRAGCSTVEETYAEARTAARAICLAALKAVGVFAVAVDTKGEIYFGGEDSKRANQT